MHEIRMSDLSLYTGAIAKCGAYRLRQDAALAIGQLMKQTWRSMVTSIADALAQHTATVSYVP